MTSQNKRLHHFVQTMKAQRIARGMSMAALAKKSGYHRRTIESWESGVMVPRLEAFIDVCEALGMEIYLEDRRPESHTDPAL